MTLRRRLLLALGALVTVVVVVGIVVTLAQRSYLLRQTDRELTALVVGAATHTDLWTSSTASSGQTGAVAGAAAAGQAPVLPNNTYLGLVDEAGRVVTVQAPARGATSLIPTLPQPPPTRPATVGTTDQLSPMRVLAVPVPGHGYVVVGLPLRTQLADIRMLALTMVVASAVILGVMGLVLWWVFRLGLRPIQQMTEAADAIAAGDVGRRVPEVAAPGTEAGRLGRALNVMIDANQASEQRLRDFVADASHELRTPLTTLRGYAELHLASEHADDAQVSDAMRRIRAEAARMGRIVDDLLTLADVDQGVRLRKEPVNLSIPLTDLAADAAVLQPNREVVTEVPGELWVLGDADRLTQVFGALTANVLRHTPPAAGLVVRGLQLPLAPDGRWVRVEVVDRGPGIPPAELSRVFDRFHRASPERSGPDAGHGLGLAIVASLVTAHGGRFGAKSDGTSGTTVWVELPGAAAAKGLDADALSDPSPASR